ncbi:unnamed protein product, partial [marine sediment metagenome]
MNIPRMKKIEGNRTKAVVADRIINTTRIFQLSLSKNLYDTNNVREIKNRNAASVSVKLA